MIIFDNIIKYRIDDRRSSIERTKIKLCGI